MVYTKFIGVAMKYLIINSVVGCGSTGKIVYNLYNKLVAEGNQCVVAWGRTNTVNDEIATYRIGTKIDLAVHLLKARLFDTQGFESKHATRKFVKWIGDYKPDIIWIHNIHGYYINLEILFNYIKINNIKVIWTLHDCWAFTGHCAYFSYSKCDKWKDGCYNCINKINYPASYLCDNSKRNFQKKKDTFTGVNDLKIIVPSRWLKGLVEESFLNEYPIEVVYNKIDYSIYKPTASDFRKKNKLENKKIILGVASPWSSRKGLSDFVRLSETIEDDYRIVLVGLTKKQIKKLPSRIIGLEKTDSAQKLAALYTMADVYLNLTYEDNYPTTNLEAQACGTPCITYNTGGSVESVTSDNVVEQGNMEMLIAKIKELC